MFAFLQCRWKAFDRPHKCFLSINHGRNCGANFLVPSTLTQSLKSLQADLKPSRSTWSAASPATTSRQQTGPAAAGLPTSSEVLDRRVASCNLRLSGLIVPVRAHTSSWLSVGAPAAAKLTAVYAGPRRVTPQLCHTVTHLSALWLRNIIRNII